MVRLQFVMSVPLSAEAGSETC